jgi:FkbM family methyltransferase
MEALNDAVILGPQFVMRYASLVARRPTHEFKIGGYGLVTLRLKTSDAQVFRQVFNNQDYALPDAHADRIRKRYESMLARGVTPLIVDAGANVGAATIWFGLRYPEAEIVAIEPDRGNAAMCRRNTAANGRVEVLEVALGGSPGNVSITNEAGGAWGLQTVRASDGEIPVTTIGRILRDRSRRKPTELLIVKIDIEGFEEEVFDGDVAWLDETCAVVVEPHDWLLPGKHTSRTLQRAMFSREFEFIVRGENVWFVS